MSIRRLSTKPRGFLRDATLITALVFLEPRTGFLIAGAALFVAGVLLHFWSKGCLVRNWELTTSGPYRFVRHPFYLANLMIDEGICLASGCWWLVGLYLGAFSLVYLPTIRREEQSLAASYGEAFAAYRSRTPALFPYRVWSILGESGFEWANIDREKEIARILRILAIPLYFAVVIAIVHELPAGQPHNLIMLCASVALALLLHWGGARSHRKRKRLMQPATGK